MIGDGRSLPTTIRTSLNRAIRSVAVRMQLNHRRRGEADRQYRIRADKRHQATQVPASKCAQHAVDHNRRDKSAGCLRSRFSYASI